MPLTVAEAVADTVSDVEAVRLPVLLRELDPVLLSETVAVTLVVLLVLVLRVALAVHVRVPVADDVWVLEFEWLRVALPDKLIVSECERDALLVLVTVMLVVELSVCDFSVVTELDCEPLLLSEALPLRDVDRVHVIVVLLVADGDSERDSVADAVLLLLFESVIDMDTLADDVSSTVSDPEFVAVLDSVDELVPVLDLDRDTLMDRVPVFVPLVVSDVVVVSDAETEVVRVAVESKVKLFVPLLEVVDEGDFVLVTVRDVVGEIEEDVVPVVVRELVRVRE